MSLLSVRCSDYPSTPFRIPPLKGWGGGKFHNSFFKAFPYLSDVLGWGLYDATGEQSRYLRQVYLTVNTSITDCGCTDDYYIQTNVGPRGQDPCAGDSGNILTNFLVEVVSL